MKKILGLLIISMILMMGCLTEEKVYEGTIVLVNNVDGQITVRIDGSEYDISANNTRNFKVDLENSTDEDVFNVEYKITGREDFMETWVVLSAGNTETVIVNPGMSSEYELSFNSTIAGVTGQFEGIDFDIDFDNSVIFEIPMLENEDSDFSLNYAGRFVFDEHTTVGVEEGFDYTYNIYPNCGEIVINNQSSSHSIVEVYLSPTTDDSWGIDDLDGTIYTNQSVTWRADQGSWDIQIVDNEGTPYYIFDQDLNIEGTLEFTLTDARNSIFTNVDKKADKSNEVKSSEKRTELVR